MAHAQETRDLVRRKYVFDHWNLEQAAKYANIPKATARTWKEKARQAGDDWDKLRAAHFMAQGGLENIGRTILSGFLVQYQTTIEELNLNTDISPTDKVQALSSLADAYNKTIAANKKVLPETSHLATALEVLAMLGAFVQTKYPKHLAAFVEVLEPFGVEVEKKFG